MASIKLSVPDPLAAWVQSRVSAGRYASVSEYLGDLIRRDQVAASERDRFPPELQASIERGVADSVAGRVYDAADVFDRLDAKYEAMAAVAEGVKVAFTADAQADLEAIADQIAKDAPRRAISFVRELRASASLLARTPRAYPFVAGFESLGMRRRVHGAYLIFYRIEGERLDILRIIHGARDYPGLLDPSETAP